MTRTIKPTAGRGWAYLGVVLGGGLSVAANLAHSLIAPAGAPESWSPTVGAVVASIAWPVLMGVGLEVLIKPDWRRASIWGRIAVYAGLAPIVAVAGVVSYRHMHGLLQYYGEEPLVAAIGPIAVDGLMLMSTAALVLIRNIQRGIRTRTTAVRPRAPRTLPHEVAHPSPTTAPAVAVDAPPAQAAGTATAARPRRSAATTQVAQPATPQPVAKAGAPSTHDSPVTAVAAAPTPKLPAPSALQAKATHIAKAFRDSAGRPITPNELAVRMKVNSDTAAQLLAVMALSPDSPLTPHQLVNGSKAAPV